MVFGSIRLVRAVWVPLCRYCHNVFPDKAEGPSIIPENHPALPILMLSRKSLFAAAAAVCVLSTGVYFLLPLSPKALVVASLPVAQGEAPIPAPVPEPVVRAEDAGPLSITPSQVAAVPRRADFAKVVAFNDWAAAYVAADAPTRLAMKDEGVRLAMERRPEFKALIVTDPQRALERAVPRVVRQDLPGEIVAQLERPVSATGDLVRRSDVIRTALASSSRMARHGPPRMS